MSGFAGRTAASIGATCRTRSGPGSSRSTVLVGSMGALMNVSFIDLQSVDVAPSQDPAATLDAVAQLGQPA
jgi:hypothetical protein